MVVHLRPRHAAPARQQCVSCATIRLDSLGGTLRRPSCRNRGENGPRHWAPLWPLAHVRSHTSSITCGREAAWRGCMGRTREADGDASDQQTLLASPLLLGGIRLQGSGDGNIRGGGSLRAAPRLIFADPVARRRSASLEGKSSCFSVSTFRGYHDAPGQKWDFHTHSFAIDGSSWYKFQFKRHCSACKELQFPTLLPCFTGRINFTRTKYHFTTRS
jgi:hypothetical protein